MKNAKKFMVVPYEEKKVEVANKPSNTKITEILNNPKIDKDDKVKLINQLLIPNINVDPSNNNVNETFDTSYKNTFDNNVHFDQTFENPNQTVNTQIKSKTPKNKAKNRKLISLEKQVNKLNASINKGYLALAPAFSTRVQRNQFSESPVDISISTVPKRKRTTVSSGILQKKLKTAVDKSIVEDESMNISQSGNGWSVYKG